VSSAAVAPDDVAAHLAAFHDAARSVSTNAGRLDAAAASPAAVVPVLPAAALSAAAPLFAHRPAALTAPSDAAGADAARLSAAAVPSAAAALDDVATHLATFHGAARSASANAARLDAAAASPAAVVPVRPAAALRAAAPPFVNGLHAAEPPASQFSGRHAYLARVADDMLKRQPWLATHEPSVPASQAERPADVKAYLVQRRLVHINCPAPKVPFRKPFRDGQSELLERFHLAKRTINGARRKLLTVSRLDGLPTALRWVVPPVADAPAWQHELHSALHQPTSRDDAHDVFSPGARLDVPSLRRLGFEPALCDEIEKGEKYQFDTLPGSFSRDNYGS
jgi:hypothetical protein